jgi:predicted RNA-binding protein associated with RNAse of E/G family
MKEKRLTEVYMREVLEKDIKFKEDSELNCYLTFKHIIKTSQSCTNYINGKKVVVVDNGYTILEYTPKDKNYNVRVFIDTNGNIIKYYFDIIKSFKVINNEIYYQDLYLDIIYDTKYANNNCNYLTVLDEKELLEAYETKKITKEDLDLTYKTADKLIDEITNNKNKFVNRGNKDYFSFIDNK